MRSWVYGVLVATVFVYAAYLIGAYYTITHLPPIPSEVVTDSGKLLFTEIDIKEGKYLLQKYGLQDYGSVLGFGGYFGVDYTSYMVKFISEEDAGVKNYLKNLNGKVIVSESFARGYERGVDYFSKLFGENSEKVGLKPNLISDKGEVRKIVSYFTWSAMIAFAGYTNGFPYHPGYIEPKVDVTIGTWITFFAILLSVMFVAGFLIIKFLDYWNDPRTPVSLPEPTKAQKIALFGMLLAVFGLGIQGLLGGYLMHKYAEPSSLFGMELNAILPFNTARALHYTLAVLWIVVSWISFALFVLPYFGIGISEKRVLGILGLGAIVSLGTLFGIYASYMQLIPGKLWFLVGAQGRPVITQGSVWLTIIALTVFYLAYLFYKASKLATEILRPFAKILSISLAGTAAGAFIGALPLIQPWEHFTVDEYLRWITIHSFVEGFWPPIVITILVSLLIIAGLLPVRLGLSIVGVDAILEIATGMIGTAHHYYWGGQPTFWLYVGALFSTLEVIPIGFLIAYSLVIWRRSKLENELQKTLLTFILIAAFGGAVGVVAFGAGMINMPIINYYIHGSQGTMVHAHLAMPLAYGIPTVLMWVVAFYLSGGLSERWLRIFRFAGIIFAVGFYLQVILSLGLIMPKQFSVVLDEGYWYMKSLFTTDWEPGFWMRNDIIIHVWSRIFGDLVSAVAIALFITALLTGYLKIMRGR